MPTCNSSSFNPISFKEYLTSSSLFLKKTMDGSCSRGIWERGVANVFDDKKEAMGLWSVQETKGRNLVFNLEVESEGTDN